MSQSLCCPACRAELPSGAAPEGLCPRCLLLAADDSGLLERDDA